MRKHSIKILTVLIIVLSLFACAACDETWFDDERSENPVYHENASFVLELRMPSGESEKEDWDAYPHSKLDGELIKSWKIPVYGNTLYESVEAHFPADGDDFSFKLSQHKFYMFHECTADGQTYNLETVYVAADGKYASCANYQTLLGDDGEIGTDDDVKTVTLVYKGWLY